MTVRTSPVAQDLPAIGLLLMSAGVVRAHPPAEDGQGR